MTAATITAPQGWTADRGREPGDEVFRRDYACGAHGQIERYHDGKFTAYCWRNRDERVGGRDIILPYTPFDCLADAVAAVDKATADFPPIAQLGVDEAYRRIDHGGESLLVADVKIPRSAVEEYLIENLFQDHDGGEIRFSYSTSGDITAHLRANDRDER